MKSEPVMLVGGVGMALVQALLVLLISFHVPISADQQAAITGFAGIALALIARQHVTPMATLPPGVVAQLQAK